MADVTPGVRLTTGRLILWPAIFTLALTFLRLVGELKRWPMPWFNSAAGGAGALVGIVWLPLILGPYFAFRVRFEIMSPRSMTKWVGYAVLGLGVSAAGLLASRAPGMTPLARLALPVLGLALGAAIQYAVWPELVKVLLAYGYSARVPVVVVALLAMSHNWATHYNASPPFLPEMSFWPKFFATVAFPQLVGWVGYTVVSASMTGAFAAGLLRRRPSEV
ncbi:MAG: hypothetical protein ACLQOO_02060 [Terriglobia bacterium]